MESIIWREERRKNKLEDATATRLWEEERLACEQSDRHLSEHTTVWTGKSLPLPTGHWILVPHHQLAHPSRGLIIAWNCGTGACMCGVSTSEQRTGLAVWACSQPVRISDEHRPHSVEGFVDSAEADGQFACIRNSAPVVVGMMEVAGSRRANYRGREGRFTC